MDDLVKRLLSKTLAVRHRPEKGYIPMNPDGKDAVEALETLTADLAAAEAKLAQAVEIAHGYHVKACKRMENDPAEYDRHAECASTAGSIAHAIRALATIQPEGGTDD